MKSVFADNYTLMNLSEGDRISLTSEEQHHLFQVRRASTSEVVRVYDGKGSSAEASCDVKTTSLVFHRLVESVSPPVSISLHAAQLKPSAWEWLLEKCTELTVRNIHALITDHVEDSTLQQVLKKQERFRRFCIDGMKQSGALFLPTLHPPQALSLSVQQALQAPSHHVIAVEPQHPHQPLHESLWNEFISSRVPIHIWIGPEGGWSPQDLETLKPLLSQNRGKHVTVPHIVFRAETAALFFVSNILYSSLVRSTT